MRDRDAKTVPAAYPADGPSDSLPTMFGKVLPLRIFCALQAQNVGSLTLNGLHGEMQLKFSPSSRACGLLVGGSTNRKEILYAGSSRCSLLLGLRTSYHRSDASRNLPAWYML